MEGFESVRELDSITFEIVVSRTSLGLATAPLHQGVQCNTRGWGPTEAVHGWFMT